MTTDAAIRSAAEFAEEYGLWSDTVLEPSLPPVTSQRPARCADCGDSGDCGQCRGRGCDTTGEPCEQCGETGRCPWCRCEVCGAALDHEAPTGTRLCGPCCAERDAG